MKITFFVCRFELKLPPTYHYGLVVNWTLSCTRDQSIKLNLLKNLKLFYKYYKFHKRKSEITLEGAFALNQGRLLITIILFVEMLHYLNTLIVCNVQIIITNFKVLHLMSFKKSSLILGWS